MNTSKLPIEVADIFRKFDHLLGILTPEHYKVIRAIKNCRTKVLGGHSLECGSCGYKKNFYNSCRNRHCPKCQYLKQVKWVEKRCEELLPCEYFHVVFTVPPELRSLFLINKKEMYSLLFKSSSDTLKEVTSMQAKSDVEMGHIGVLHTWGQNLLDHPHIHFIVPGGTLNKKKTKWIASDENYLLPVKVLSKVFMGIFLKGLREHFDTDELKFIGSIDYLEDPRNFQELLTSCSQKKWVVYCKKPFAGAKQVLSYLGQYTHRIAISNYRLVKLEGEIIFFKVRDRNSPENSKVMSLHVVEFMRRFLLHVLPKGFVRIRHFGILGNRYKKEKIGIIRKLKNVVEKLLPKFEEDWGAMLMRLTSIDPDLCPVGKLKFVEGFSSMIDTT